MAKGWQGTDPRQKESLTEWRGGPGVKAPTLESCLGHHLGGLVPVTSAIVTWGTEDWQPEGKLRKPGAGPFSDSPGDPHANSWSCYTKWAMAGGLSLSLSLMYAHAHTYTHRETISWAIWSEHHFQWSYKWFSFWGKDKIWETSCRHQNNRIPKISSCLGGSNGSKHLWLGLSPKPRLKSLKSPWIHMHNVCSTYITPCHISFKQFHTVSHLLCPLPGHALKLNAI